MQVEAPASRSLVTCELQCLRAHSCLGYQWDSLDGRCGLLSRQEALRETLPHPSSALYVRRRVCGQTGAGAEGVTGNNHVIGVGWMEG